MFGRNIRAERPRTRRLWALRPSRATWLPKLGSLPHTSQRFDISILLERLHDGMPTAHRDVDREGRSAAAKAVVDGMGNKGRTQRAASEIDRCRLPDEVSLPVPSLEHAADRNGMLQRVQPVYDLRGTPCFRWSFVAVMPSRLLAARAAAQQR
jgi:hypothetical protein